MSKPRLLAQRYKTHDGAVRRARFENALAQGEYERGEKAHLYYYSIRLDGPKDWRVLRTRDDVMYPPARRRA